MDSLTQIVLGAAVAEVVGGRKLGNKAMMWGAVAGTIPDLDVLAKFFMSPIDSLAAHRGFSHSILFSILASILLAYIVKWMYNSKWYRTIASGSYYLLTILVLVGINLLSFRSGNWLWYLLPISGLVMAAVGWLLYRKYNKENLVTPDLKTRDWGWLFFWSIFTHPLLDCFTAYGTQLFYPFSHYRVAFNNISVVDPGYTIFLILALLVAARLVKTSSLRRKINIAGLVLSSAYMVFTLYNKYTVGTIFESALQDKNISYSRYMTNPTIFNNILWYGIAESDSAFHYGFYSLLDKDKEFVLSSRKKSQNYIKANLDNHIIGTLDWFSNGYNGMTPFVHDTARYYDYRYGPILMDGKETNPFAMIIVKNPDGSLKMIENTPATNKKFDKTKAIKELYKRIGL